MASGRIRWLPCDCLAVVSALDGGWEADALRILEDSPLPVPRLVAVDPTGELAGSPALLMTALPGRVDWSPRDLNA